MAESKRSVFFRRLSVTIGLWVVVGVALVLGWDWFYALLIGGAALMALREFYALVRATGAGEPSRESRESGESEESNGGSADAPANNAIMQSRNNAILRVFPKLGLWGAAVYLVASYFWLHDAWLRDADVVLRFDVAFVAGFVFVVFLWQMRLPATERDPLEGIAYTVFGFLYIPWLFNFVAKILFMVPRGEDGSLVGIYYVLFLLVVTKFSDMGAYAFGSLFGRHPFVLHISPKKTWEGVAGAIVASLIGAWGIYALAASHLAVLRIGDVTVLALLLGVAAIAGDLAASVLKRSAGIKDSSNVLPGIGGALDLIDSLLFAAPIFYFYLRCIAG